MTQVAAQNPIAYYNLVDYASRICGRCTMASEEMLVLGFCTHLPRGCSRVCSKQLFTSKQQVKAYISSVASWVKAFILTIGPEPQAAASGAGGGQELGSEGWVRMVASLEVALVDLLTALRESTSSASAELQEEDFEDALAYVRTAELSMLLWVSRPVRVVAQRLLHHLADEEQQDLASSSSSRHGIAAASEGTSSSSSRGDGVGGASGIGQLAISVGGGSSSCGVASNQVNSSVECSGSSSPGADDAVRGSSSSSSGAWGSSHVTSTAAHGSSGNSTGGVCSQEGSRFLITAPSSICVAGTNVAVMLHKGLKQWQAVHSARVQTATSAAEVPLAAGAATAAPHDGNDAPSRLSGQLCEGLPIAVVEQLQECSSRWPMEEGSSSSSDSSDMSSLSRDHSLGDFSCDEDEMTSNSSATSSTDCSTSGRSPREVQRLVLGDVIKLCQVLQHEVPTIVGCNNPTCLNLTGMLESAASRKVCTGCNVAHYCSRECQVGHWKEHMVACRRLQKGQGTSTGKQQQQ